MMKHFIRRAVRVSSKETLLIRRKSVQILFKSEGLQKNIERYLNKIEFHRITFIYIVWQVYTSKIYTKSDLSISRGYDGIPVLISLFILCLYVFHSYLCFIRALISILLLWLANLRKGIDTILHFPRNDSQRRSIRYDVVSKGAWFFLTVCRAIL